MGLCSRCHLDSIEILGCPQSVEVTVCPTCGSLLEGSRWRPGDFSDEDLIRHAVLKAVSVHRDLNRPNIDLKIIPRGATRFVADITVIGHFREIDIAESCQIHVRLQRRACERCSRIAGKYFEGIVQIRRSGNPPEKADLDQVAGIAVSLADSGHRRGDPLSFIQDIKEVRGGIDIVVGSTQLARHIAKAAVQHLGGGLKESAKIAGCRDGQEIYRTTILVRLPRLRIGYVIRCLDGIYEVTGFKGRRTEVSSIEDGSILRLSLEEADNAEILGKKDDAEKGLIVLVDDNAVEILDPVSYRTVIATKPKHMHIEAGKEIEFLRTNAGLLLLR